MIMATLAACVADLVRRGIYQWNEDYPGEDVIREDIDRGHLFIIREADLCAGIIVLNELQDAEWSSVPWAPSRRPLAVHRLLVHPDRQREGVGRALMGFAMRRGRELGCDALRFDVYSGNPELVRTYERMGCVRRGEVFFPHRELSFYCYDMVWEAR
jgi:GNAT superfamily N-acetyltransferase